MTELDDILDAVKAGAECVAENFTKADDDWLPMGFIGTSEKRLIPVRIEPRREAMFGGECTAILAEITRDPDFVAVLEGEEIEFVAFLASAWALSFKQDDPRAENMGAKENWPSEQPDRIEALSIYSLARDGEAHMDWARILRFEDQAPVLAKWQRLHEDLKVGGAVISNLRAVFA